MATALERLRQIKSREAKAQALPAPACGGMTLTQFAGSGKVVVIDSTVLCGTVVFAADNARVSESEMRPVYRAWELTGLEEWTPDGLRLLHEVKTQFRVEIMPDEKEKAAKTCINLNETEKS